LGHRRHHRNLGKEVEQGGFRDDLYYRLSTISIYIEPPQPAGGHSGLIDYYIRDTLRSWAPGSDQPESEAFAKLSDYPWPETCGTSKRHAADHRLGEGGKPSTACWPRHREFFCRSASSAASTPRVGEMFAGHRSEIDLSDLSLKKIRKKTMNQVERELINHVLIKTGWNRSKASRILKISYKTLLQKIGELQIAPPPELA
jgi:DNA-binding NtrC family response regulator